MNTNTIIQNKNTTGSYFPSLTALRDKHSEILQEYYETEESGVSSQLLSEIEDFILKNEATGVVLYPESDRRVAQTLLSYWTSTLYRLNLWDSLDKTLKEFDPELAPELPDNSCPYLGLEAFKEDKSHLFYGRQQLLNKLLEKFRDSRLLAVVGASGSGKSSLVLGGLIPSLKGGKLPESEQWHYYPSIVPGSEPLRNLARLFCSQSPEENVCLTEYVTQFSENPDYLLQLLSHQNSKPSVLIIDQFEEIFTLCQDETKRQAFISNLLQVIQYPEIPHRVILTIRSDFESKVKKLTVFDGFFQQGRESVRELGADELRQAIEKPAEIVGLKFQEGLVDQLIKDVLGEPAALPLLQFTLLKLWGDRQRNRITKDAYDKLGNCRLALSKSANEFYDNLIPEEQVICRRIFLKMVRPNVEEYNISEPSGSGESKGTSKSKIVGWEVTSKRIPKQELYETEVGKANVEKVLEKLINARLIKETKGQSDKDTQVEVAHEALIRNWDTLGGWLDDERDDLKERFKLTAKAEEWEAKGKDKGALLRGKLLEETLQLKNLGRLGKLNESEKLFIQESEKIERRSKWNRRILAFCGIIGLIIVTLAPFGSIWYARKQNESISKELRQKKTKLKQTNAQIDTLKKNQSKETIKITKILDNSMIDPLTVALKKNRTISTEEMKNIKQKAFEIRAIVEEGNILATESEIKGFESLVDNNLKEAKESFAEAYKFGPTYHSVDEILHLVLTEERLTEYYSPNTSDDRKQQIINDIYKEITTKYPWRAPEEQIAEMKKRIGN